MNKYLPVALAAVLALLGIITLYICYSNATAALALERAEHAATRLEYSRAVEEGLRWVEAYNGSNIKLKALQGQSAACLEREWEAWGDAAARAAIMHNVQTRVRSEAEKMEVADDATRKAAMDRLNRPL